MTVLGGNPVRPRGSLPGQRRVLLSWEERSKPWHEQTYS